MRCLPLFSRSRKPLSSVVYSTISASAKDGRWVEAHALIKKMKTRGLPPDVIKYSAAIAACEKGGRWEEELARFLARWHHSAAPPVSTQSISPLYKFLRRDTSAIFGPFTLGYRCIIPCARRTTKSSVGTSTCFWRRLEDGLFQLIN